MKILKNKLKMKSIHKTHNHKTLKKVKFTKKNWRNRSTSPDATREALEKWRHSRNKSRSLLPRKKTTIIVEGLWKAWLFVQKTMLLSWKAFFYTKNP